MVTIHFRRELCPDDRFTELLLSDELEPVPDELFDDDCEFEFALPWFD